MSKRRLSKKPTQEFDFQFSKDSEEVESKQTEEFAFDTENSGRTRTKHGKSEEMNADNITEGRNKCRTRQRSDNTEETNDQGKLEWEGSKQDQTISLN